MQRLGTANSDWCPKLTSSRQFNCALRTPLDTPIAACLSSVHFLLQMEPDCSIHSVRSDTSSTTATSGKCEASQSKHTAEGLGLQAEPQIGFVSLELVERFTWTSSSALHKTTSGLLSSPNTTPKKKQIPSSSLLSTYPFFIFLHLCHDCSVDTGILTYIDADSCTSGCLLSDQSHFTVKLLTACCTV